MSPCGYEPAQVIALTGIYVYISPLAFRSAGPVLNNISGEEERDKPLPGLVIPDENHKIFHARWTLIFLLVFPQKCSFLYQYFGSSFFQNSFHLTWPSDLCYTIFISYIFLKLIWLWKTKHPKWLFFTQCDSAAHAGYFRMQRRTNRTRLLRSRSSNWDLKAKHIGLILNIDIIVTPI